MESMDERILAPARVVWDYLQLKHHPIPAELMVVFGTNDLRVAAYAARLYRDGLAPSVLFTGGVAHQGDLLATPWTRSEAEIFADAAVAAGVPRHRILLEPRACNTAENVRYTRRLLEELGLRPRNLLLVCKPFMQRRVWATMAVEWPEMPASLASQSMTLEEYFTEELPLEKIVPIMLGDLQRVWVYGKRGWSAAQRVPDAVMGAYHELAAMGFTQHLIAEA